MILTIFLSACATQASNLPVPKAYSKEFQEDVAKEIVVIAPVAPKIIIMLGDYSVLRDQVRVK